MHFTLPLLSFPLLFVSFLVPALTTTPLQGIGSAGSFVYFRVPVPNHIKGCSGLVSLNVHMTASIDPVFATNLTLGVGLVPTRSAYTRTMNVPHNTSGASLTAPVELSTLRDDNVFVGVLLSIHNDISEVSSDSSFSIKVDVPSFMGCERLSFAYCV